MKTLEIIWSLLSLASTLLAAHKQGVEIDDEAIRRLTIDDLVQKETFDEVVARKEKEAKG